MLGRGKRVRKLRAELVEWVGNYIAWDALGLAAEAAVAKENVRLVRAELNRKGDRPHVRE